MGIFSSFSLQNVTGIEARAYSDLESAPLIITFRCDDIDGGWSEATIHTGDKQLSLALVEAINGAVASVKAKRTVVEIAA